VAINVHGSEDQAKDASFCRSVRDHISVFSRPVHALRRVHADVVPFLSALWTSVVAGASPRGEETRSRRRTEPRSAFRRCPAKVNAIPQTGMPSTVASASGVHPLDCSTERILRVGPSLTPPTRSPQAVEGAFRALQAPECGHPRSLAFEEQAPLLPMGSILSDLSCLGLTTQARPSARPSWLVCES